MCSSVMYTIKKKETIWLLQHKNSSRLFLSGVDGKFTESILGKFVWNWGKQETTSAAGVVALNTIIQKAFGSLQLQTASEQLLLHSIGFSSLTFPVFLSLRLAHNVVYSFGMVGFSTKLSVK